MKSKKKVQPGAMKRRWFVLGAPSVILGSVLAGPASALNVTPRQSEGPFYPRVLPEDSDADLTSFNGQRVSGEVIEIVGRLLATSGEPIARGEVEIWHCDPNGVYAHVGQETVSHFQGFGAVRTAESGGYRFRTTLPGIYPGRARHVHIKARGQRGLFLTTQMYFPGEADNGQDFLLMRASDPSALIAQKEPGPPPKFRFDIFLA